MRPPAGVGKLKHAPPMQANDLPLVAQAISPANRIFSQHLTVAALTGVARFGAATVRERLTAVRLFPPKNSRPMKTLILLLAASGVLSAGQTRTWTQGEAADFEKGNLKNLALRSDGRLTLAPATRELFDTTESYLWALARDSKGNLYAGGGTSAKLYRIPPDGKGKLRSEEHT